MAGSVGVLGTKCWAKCIDILKGQGKCLTVKLTAYSKICLLTKEVLRIIHLTVLSSWRIVYIKGGNPKHFPGSLCVTSCNYRRMHIYKISFLKEFMNRIGY